MIVTAGITIIKWVCFEANAKMKARIDIIAMLFANRLLSLISLQIEPFSTDRMRLMFSPVFSIPSFAGSSPRSIL